MISPVKFGTLLQVKLDDQADATKLKLKLAEVFKTGTTNTKDRLGRATVEYPYKGSKHKADCFLGSYLVNHQEYVFAATDDTAPGKELNVDRKDAFVTKVRRLMEKAIIDTNLLPKAPWRSLVDYPMGRFGITPSILSMTDKPGRLPTVDTAVVMNPITTHGRNDVAVQLYNSDGTQKSLVRSEMGNNHKVTTIEVNNVNPERPLIDRTRVFLKKIVGEDQTNEIQALVTEVIGQKPATSNPKPDSRACMPGLPPLEQTPVVRTPIERTPVVKIKPH